MADERRFMDVWLVERNTVYREVPFTVIGDWIQEGRLVAKDKVRPAGSSSTWQPLSESPLFTPYIPKASQNRAEDAVEAMEPVEMELKIKKPPEAEDDDPDMIPLIDISMVLLVFFMMSASTLLNAGGFDTPEAEFPWASSRENSIGIGMKEVDGRIQYFLEGQEEPTTETAILRDLEARYKESGKTAKVILKADRTLQYEKVQAFTIGIEKIGMKIHHQVQDKPRTGGEHP